MGERRERIDGSGNNELCGETTCSAVRPRGMEYGGGRGGRVRERGTGHTVCMCSDL